MDGSLTKQQHDKQHAQYTLFDAVRSGDGNKIEMLLSSNSSSVNDKDERGRTPLSHAAENGRTDTCILLIYRGASLDEKDKYGRTPLSYAAGKNCTDTCALLIDYGASLDVKDKFGQTPLSHAAMFNGRPDTCALLIDCGASLDVKDNSGHTPLSYAVMKGHADTCALLLDRSPLLDKKRGRGGELLWLAAKNDHINTCTLLIDRGVSLDVKDYNGQTLLLWAVINGRTDIRTLLIDRGVSLDEKDKCGQTPLLWAAKNDRIDICALLLKQGAALEVKDNYRQTPLSYAAAKGHLAVVTLLLNEGASVNGTAIRNESSRGCETCLTLAGRAGHMKIFENLIKAGAYVNVRAPDGETPLISISRWDYAPGVQLLLKNIQVKFNNQLIEEIRLLPDTLEAMDKLCRNTFEFEKMHTQVMNRLHDILTQLEHQGGLGLDSDALTTFITISFRFCRLLFRCERMERPLSRFTASRVILRSAKGFNEELDHFVRLQNLVLNDANWKHQWPQDEMKIPQCICDKLSDDELRLHGVDNNEKFDTSVLLEHETRNVKENNDSERYELVQEVKTRFLRVCEIEAPIVPDWFISPDDVEYNKWNAVIKYGENLLYDGKWLRTEVTIAVPNVNVGTFQEAASRWHSLNHPRVRKLFGASHLGRKPFFVCESGTRVLDVLADKSKQHFTWKYLHEAALGLQYLHQRNIVHGDLRCQNIIVGSDDKAKLAGFGEHYVDGSRNRMESDQRFWKALESYKSASQASDIYALGMCIVEAITLSRPWGSTDKYILCWKVQKGELPPRPEALNDDQWDLITKMCTFKPAERVRIAFVVHQLNKFAIQRSSSSPSSEKDSTETQWNGIEDTIFPELEGSTISETLEYIQKRCADLPDSQWMIMNVCPALEFVFEQLKLQQKQPSDIAVVKYCTALSKLKGYLRVALSESSIAHAIRSRRVAESHHVIYQALDRLLDMLSVNQDNPVRRWKSSGQSIDGRLMKNNSSVIKVDAMEANTNSEPVSLIYYGSSAAASISSTSDTPSWYLPLRELIFSQSSDKIGEGAFGAVYKGVWLDTPIVVKFMGYKDDSEISTKLFLHEVQVWHRLNHPHIVKLYGACHVDKRYFVCEYAPNGDLSGFVKNDSNRHLLWKRLYEVALSLEYLHGLNIAHNDLKCDNVLIGIDGKAKLIDFGLSAILNEAEVMIDVKQMGAVHWKSPEYLVGGRPSLASDVYSFAMCILETVTDDVPWGRNMLAGVVKYYVKKGNIPTRPEQLSDKQWNLVELMTKSDPSERVNMAFVVDKLFEISQTENDRVVSAAAPQ